MSKLIMSEAIECLAWDSRFLGRRVGRINLGNESELAGLFDLADHRGYDLLYVYSLFPVKKPLIAAYSMLDVGGHITFVKRLFERNPERMPRIPTIREYQRDSLTPELLEVALLSGHLSRFRVDHSLPAGSLDRLYEIWLAKALKNRPNSAIYTYESDGIVSGLITAQWCESKCTIGLLAVLHSYRGRGIATSLIAHVQEMCIANSIGSIVVKTQLSNTSARSLYLKNSFLEQDRSFLYHGHRL